MARPAHSKVPVLLLLVAGCARTPAHSDRAPDGEAKPSAAAPGSAPNRAHDAPASEGLLGVPEWVAKLHRNAFRESDVDPKVGRVVCFVTLHDAALQRGEVFPLVLFTDGSVATWRQTRERGEEPFFAKLSAEEQASAPELIEAIPRARGTARETFRASALVMGVSVRVNGQVETLYFDHDQIPATLGRLVALLKQRLEATKR